MTDPISKETRDSVLSRAVDATPAWVWAFCGGMVTMTVCVIAVLQLGGFSPPLQRIMNAKATEIERAAERISASADAIEGVMRRVDSVENRVEDLERRVDAIDKTHGQ